jgi:hypothetical protein
MDVCRRYFTMKSVTDMVSESFIWSVGITRPKRGQEKLAAYYICGTLAATVLGVIGLFVFLLHQL